MRTSLLEPEQIRYLQTTHVQTCYTNNEILDISYRDHVLIRYALNTFHNVRRVRARCVSTMGMLS